MDAGTSARCPRRAAGDEHTAVRDPGERENQQKWHNVRDTREYPPQIVLARGRSRKKRCPTRTSQHGDANKRSRTLPLKAIDHFHRSRLYAVLERGSDAALIPQRRPPTARRSLVFRAIAMNASYGTRELASPCASWQPDRYRWHLVPAVPSTERRVLVIAMPPAASLLCAIIVLQRRSPPRQLPPQSRQVSPS